MSNLPKTFSYDYAVRDSAGRPIGRVILSGRKFEAGRPLPVALLIVPATFTRNVLSCVFYLDGVAYKVPEDTPKLKISFADGQHKVNHVVLQPVG